MTARGAARGQGAALRGDVFLITLDTTRADALGCYGAPPDRSPHLDVLAREGVLFERCSANSGITPVSHASILTGLLPDRHGLRVFGAASGYRLADGIPTLASLLREHGWTTLAVQSAFPVSPAFGLERGFDVVEPYGEGFLERAGKGAADLARSADEFQRRSDASVDLALEHVARTQGPLFLWLHLFDPHDARLLPPAEFLRPEIAASPADDPQRRLALYAEEVRYQDAQLGRFLAGLAELGRYEGALVTVVADHGEGLADGLERHGWWGHALLYEEQLHVPLVLRAPGLPGGRRVGALARTIDLVPTVLQLVGVPVPEGLDGASLLELLEPRSAPRLAFAEQLSGYELPRPAALRKRPFDDFVHAVSDGEWKLLYRPAHPARSELFHLAEDPGEERSLLHAQPAQALRLARMLAERAPWVEHAFEDVDAAPEDSAIAQALAALGYAGDDGDGEVEARAPRWDWVCLEDGSRAQERRPCARCDRPPVLVARASDPLPAATPERQPSRAQEPAAELAALYDRAAYAALDRKQVRALAAAARERWAGELAAFELSDIERARSGGASHWMSVWRHSPTGLEFVLLPGGSFRMGSEGEGAPVDRDEAPHELTLAPFLIARAECTQAVWAGVARAAALDPAPSESAGEALPVESVSAEQADAWCQAAGLVLPTEAQWEYACRAGSQDPWTCGEQPRQLARFANLADASSPFQWKEGWDDGFPGIAPVRSLAANAFGLHDVHGNVWEWCRDDYLSYELAPEEGTGRRPGSSGRRVARGGAFDSKAGDARSSFRFAAGAGYAFEYVGFRPSLDLP